MSEPKIEINNLTKVFGSEKEQVVALNGITMHIKENEFVALVGPSGGGKVV